MTALSKKTFSFGGFAAANREVIILRTQFANIGLILLWLYAFWPTLRELFSIYASSPMDKYCIFIPYISLGLIFFKKKAFERVQPTNSGAGLVLLLLLAISWLLAVQFALVWLEQLAVIAMLPTLFWFNCGTKITQIVLFPLLLLFFLFPVGHLIEPGVHKYLNNFLLNSLTFLNIPLYWDASAISTGNSFIEIKSIIHGLCQLIFFFVFGLAYGYLLGLSLLRNSLLALAFVVFPCACLLLGVHAIARFESLTSYGMFNLINQTLLGWLFIIFGLLCSLFLGLQLRSNNNLRAHLQGNFSLQLNYQQPNSNWLPLTIAVISILAAPPWLHKVIHHIF